MLLEAFDKKILDELYKTIGPNGMRDFVKRVQEQQAAFKKATKIRISDTTDMEETLHAYPASIITELANEWNLDSHGKKNDIIEDILDTMEDIIPEIIGESSPEELAAFKYIAEHKNLEITKARRALNKSLIQPEFIEPDDPHMFDSFMKVYVPMGILIAGIKNVDGSDREIVTMSSDVKRIVSEHMGWHVDLKNDDDDDVASDTLQNVHPKPSRDGTRWFNLFSKNKKKSKHIMTGMPSSKWPNNARDGERIFKRDKIKLKPGATFNDPFEAATAYALAKYGDKFDEARRKCPYDIEHLNDDKLIFKQHMTWFLAEWINPITGDTIIKEFVDETVEDKELAEMILQFTELFFDHFEVREHRGDDVVVAYGKNTRKTYNVVTFSGNRLYPIGTIFEGRIHPYDGKYKMCGIMIKRML